MPRFRIRNCVRVPVCLAANCSAEEAFAAGEFEMALKKIGAEPTSAKQLFNVGTVELASGKLNEAIA